MTEIYHDEALTDAINQLRGTLARTSDADRSRRRVQAEAFAGSRQLHKSDWNERSANSPIIVSRAKPADENRASRQGFFGNTAGGVDDPQSLDMGARPRKYDNYSSDYVGAVNGQHEHGRRAKVGVKIGWIGRIVAAYKECPSRAIRNTVGLIGVACFAADFVLGL